MGTDGKAAGLTSSDETTVIERVASGLAQRPARQTRVLRGEEAADLYRSLSLRWAAGDGGLARF